MMYYLPVSVCPSAWPGGLFSLQSTATVSQISGWDQTVPSRKVAPSEQLHRLTDFPPLFYSTWLDCYYICIHLQQREFRKYIPQPYLICKDNFYFSSAWCCLQLSFLISRLSLEKGQKFPYWPQIWAAVTWCCLWIKESFYMTRSTTIRSFLA